MKSLKRKIFKIMKKIICVIPARSGSKGLKNKNLKKLKNLPLIAHTIIQAKKSKYISDVYVSTDSIKIANISKHYGAIVPFLRPKKLARDSSMVMDSYFYLIENIRDRKKIDDFVALLPTSPLRKTNDINQAIELYYKKKAKTLISCIENPKPIEWLLKKNAKGFIKPFKKTNPIQNRQNYEKLYLPNGSIYIFNYNTLKNTRNYYNNKTILFEMSKEKSIDIDTIYDFKVAEKIIK